MKGGRVHRLRVRQKACNACMSCQIYCVMVKEHVCAPRRARVQVELDPFDARHRIHLCRQCEKAACAEACPEGAITLSEDGSYWAIDYARCTLCRECVEACPFEALEMDRNTGAIIVDEDECDGCGLCEEACPFEMIRIHPVKETALKCDLCGGEPQCVRYCPQNALTYENGTLADTEGSGKKRVRLK